MDSRFFMEEEGWLGPIKGRSFLTLGLPGIANCASTPVKLFCRDSVTKHYREFDQKLSGGRCSDHPFGFLLC